MFSLFDTGSGLATANVSVNIDGKELTRVAAYKYLEVILDESLSWNAHVNLRTFALIVSACASLLHTQIHMPRQTSSARAKY